MFGNIKYSSRTPGKNLLITGCVHGNEPCGANAIKHVINEIRDRMIPLLSGSVTFIPVCNPLAKEKNIRYIEENLARVFNEHKNPVSYEQKLATQLTNYVKNTDAILDIHSGNALKSKFVFQDYEEPAYQELSNILGFDLVIHGWSNIYKDTTEQDITGYAHSLGIPSIVVECGQHNDPDATQIAYESILRFMGFHGIIDHPHDIAPNIKHIMMQKLYKMEKQGKFVKERKNADHISKGEVIAEYDDGEQVISDYEGYIILPKTFANIGDERFYIGTQE